MKLKALLLALFAAGIAVSIAVASSAAAVEKGKPGTGTTATDTGTTSTEPARHGKAGDHGKGKGLDKARACKPARTLVVHGEFVAPGAGGFAMTVARANHGAQSFKGKQVTVLVDEKTRFHGTKHTLAELATGDRLVVQAFACKADAAAGSLLARKVGVKGAKKDEHEDDDEATTTGTSTGTTTSTAAATTTAP